VGGNLFWTGPYLEYLRTIISALLGRSYTRPYIIKPRLGPTYHRSRSYDRGPIILVCCMIQGYINKTWGVPLTPKDQNDRLDVLSDGTIKPIKHISIPLEFCISLLLAILNYRL